MCFNLSIQPVAGLRILRPKENDKRKCKKKKINRKLKRDEEWQNNKKKKLVVFSSNHFLSQRIATTPNTDRHSRQLCEMKIKRRAITTTLHTRAYSSDIDWTLLIQ